MATVSQFTRGAVAGNGWTNAANATADDGSYATCAPGKNATVTGDWDFAAFTDTDIPVGSTINSVTIETQWHISTTSSNETYHQQNVDGGTAGTETTDTTGTTADKVTQTTAWSTLPTIAELKTAGQIVARIKGQRGNSNTAVTFSLDYIKITVDFTAGGTNFTITPSGAISSSGALGKQPQKALSGVASSAGSLIKQVAKSFAGAFAAPSGGSTYESDDFTRTVASGSGFGGDWLHFSSSSLLGCDGSRGYYANTGSTSKLNYINTAVLSQQDIRITFDAAIADLPPSTDNYIYAIVGRLIDTSNYYRLDVRLNDTGTVTFFVRYVIAGAVTTIGMSVDSSWTYTAGATIKVKAEFEGVSPTTIRLKAWLSTDSEPASWDRTETDSAATALQTSGSAGTRLLPSAAAYVTTAYLDNFLVTSIAATGGSAGMSGAVVTGLVKLLSLSGAAASAGALARQTGKAVSGAASSAGALVRQTARSASGAISSAGALAKRTAKPLSGAAASAGSLVKQTRRTFTGSATSAGLLATARVILRSFSGAIASAGGLTKQWRSTLSGISASSGSLVRQTRKVLSGSASSSGALAHVRTRLLSLAGSITSAGAFQKQVRSTFSGTVASAGTLVRQTRKVLAGGATSSGTVASIRTILRSFSGTVTSAGDLVRQTRRSASGTITSAGSLVRRTAKSFAGAIASSATLSAIRPGQNFTKSFAGTITSSGSLIRQTARSVSGVADASGSLVRQTSRLMVGAVSSAGGLVKQIGLTRSGSIDSTGSLTRMLSRAFDGMVDAVGGLTRQVAKAFAGAIGAVGDAVVIAPGTFVIHVAGSIVASGSLVASKLRQVLLVVSRGVSAVSRSSGATATRSDPSSGRDRGSTGPR